MLTLESRLPQEVLSFQHLFSVSSTSPAESADLLARLAQVLALNPSQLQTTLAAVPLEQIVGGIRTFLRDLPEPLVPTELYQNFVTVGRSQIDSDARLMMSRLINNHAHMTVHHSRTLQFFGLHLAKLVKVVEDYGREVGVGRLDFDAEKVLSIFYAGVVLRPSFDNILQILDNWSVHVRLVSLLIEMYAKDVRGGGGGSGRRTKGQDREGREQGAKDLMDAEWYWEGCSR